LFRPYLRRAPDEEEIDGTRPPDGWEMRVRKGASLPGFWSAMESRPDHLVAPDGEVCLSFSFDSARNVYVADFQIKKTMAGGNFQQRLEMPSARKILSAGKSPILGFEARILTTVAITENQYLPSDPIYQDLVYGVHWSADALDHGAKGAGWSPFAQGAEFVNSDPSGDVIFSALQPLGFQPFTVRNASSNGRIFK